MTKAQTEANAWAIGVDVGGTKVAAGFVDAQGEIHQHTRVPMNSRGTAEEGLAAVTGGGGVAAMLSPFFGEIRKNLPAWCMNKRCVEIPIVPARYGAESGIARGAALCM